MIAVLEGAALLMGSLFLLFMAILGTLVFTLCAWTGAQVFIDRLKRVDEAEELLIAEAERMELEQLAREG